MMVPITLYMPLLSPENIKDISDLVRLNSEGNIQFKTVVEAAIGLPVFIVWLTLVSCELSSLFINIGWSNSQQRKLYPLTFSIVKIVKE